MASAAAHRLTDKITYTIQSKIWRTHLRYGAALATQREAEPNPTDAIKDQLDRDQRAEQPKAGPWQAHVQQHRDGNPDDATQEHQPPAFKLAMTQRHHDAQHAADRKHYR